MKGILSRLKFLCSDVDDIEFGELKPVMKEFKMKIWYPFEDYESDNDYKEFKQLIANLQNNEVFKTRIKKAILEDKILNLQTPDHNFKNTFLQYWIANDVTDKALRILKILQDNNALQEGLYGDEMQDNHQRTALHLAIIKKYDNPFDNIHFGYNKFDKDLIEFLIDNCSKKTLVTQDELGNTPLHYAILKADQEIVDKILIKSKALGIYQELLSIKNNHQKTPIDLSSKTFQDSEKTIDEIYTGYILVENPQKSTTTTNCYGKKITKKGFDRAILSTLKSEEEWNKSQQGIRDLLLRHRIISPRQSSPIEGKEVCH